MSIQCRTLVACGILAALTLSGCEMPRPRQAAGPTRARPVSRVLDPADINLALEPEGLTVWWRHDLGQLAEGASLRKLYLVGDRLVAEMRDAKLLYFDAATGEWTGSTRLKSLLMAPPAASKGLLYVPSARNLLLVDSRTGMVSKRLLARLPVSCRPLPFADFLILGGGNGQLRCMDTLDGSQQWLLSADGAIVEPPVFSGGMGYVAGYKGRVVAFALRSGVKAWDWRPPAPSKLTSGLSMAHGLLFVGDNRGFVYCLPLEHPIVLWSYPVGGPVFGPPAPFDGRLLVFTFKGDALCLRLGDEPELLWRHPDACKLIARGRRGLYLLTRGRAIACVDPDTGREKWRLPLAEDVVVVSDPARGVFYLGGRRSGAIAAIRELD